MISIDTSICTSRTVRAQDRLIEWRVSPQVIRVDNGPVFTSEVFETLTR